MALTLGESHASTHKALQYLSETKSQIDKSTLRLASGNRIVSAADDPAGLAVAMKLQSELSVTNAKASSVKNAQSYAEMQSTALASALDLIDAMITLKGLTDQSTADSQFQELKSQLDTISAETMNGTNLFNRVDAGDPASYDIEGVSLDDLDINTALTEGGNSIISGNYADFDATNLRQIYDNVSALKTASDADASTLGFASDYLANMAINIESAHGRIMDVDIAEETINLSKLNMQQEAALAAIVQANVAMTAVLDLLIKPKD